MKANIDKETRYTEKKSEEEKNNEHQESENIGSKMKEGVKEAIGEAANEERISSVNEGEPHMPGIVIICGVCSKGFNTECDCLEHMSLHSDPLQM